MRSARTRHPPMRLGAIAAIGALLVSGLAAVSPPLAPAASAAGPLPAGAELFRVSQTDVGASTAAVPDTRRPARLLHVVRGGSGAGRPERRLGRVRLGRGAGLGRPVLGGAHARERPGRRPRGDRGERGQLAARRERRRSLCRLHERRDEPRRSRRDGGSHEHLRPRHRSWAEPSGFRAPGEPDGSSYEPDISDSGRSWSSRRRRPTFQRATRTPPPTRSSPIST